MWHDHPFSQRNKATDGGGGWRRQERGWGWIKFEKGGVGNIGGSS